MPTRLQKAALFLGGQELNSVTQPDVPRTEVLGAMRSKSQ